MKLSEAILLGRAEAYGQLSDLMRKRGKKYTDVVALVKKIFTDAGRPEPDDSEIEDKMAEADELSSRRDACRCGAWPGWWSRDHERA